MRTRLPFPASLLSAAVSVLSLLAAHGAAANDADLDPAFGVGGVAFTGLTNAGGNGARGPVVQPDGKILICDARTGDPSSGNDFMVARFDANGHLDTSFNFNGLVTIDFDGGGDNCTGIALQADGRIVVAGYTQSPTTQGAEFAIARLKPDGSLDTSFGAGTGKVVVGFDLGGNKNDTAQALAIQSDGRIVVAGTVDTASNGTDFAVLRLLPDGTRDATFNLTGKVTFGFDFAGGTRNDAVNAVAIDGSGRIVLGGVADHGTAPTPSNDFALARLLANGQLDADFDADGRATVAFNLGASGDDQLFALAIQADGRIVAAGAVDTSLGSEGNYDTAVARVLPNGALDASFGIGGKTLVPFDLLANASDYARAVLQQPDGKLALAGLAFGTGGSLAEIFAAAARLNPDGSLDEGFGSFGKRTYDLGLYAPTGQLLNGIAIQGSQIVLAGATRVHDGGGLGIDDFVLRLGTDRIFANGFD